MVKYTGLDFKVECNHRKIIKEKRERERQKWIERGRVLQVARSMRLKKKKNIQKERKKRVKERKEEKKEKKKGRKTVRERRYRGEDE